MNDSTASDALQAYLTLLKGKGATNRDLNLRKHFLRFLISELKDKPRNGEVYRQAVDVVLAGFPDQADLLVLPVCAREFYYFWIGDLRQIALLHANGGLEPKPVLIRTSGNLVNMLAEMDEAGWEASPIPVLEQYIEHLKTVGADDAVLDIRERLIRLLLFVIRELEPTARVYRAGVDALQDLFKKDEARQLFIHVAREFFYFWIERAPKQELSV